MKKACFFLVMAVILLSGCPQNGGEKPDCPYECCINGTYNAKECAAGYECEENICVEIVEEKLDCPFECCAGETYKPKACTAGYECRENKCVETEEEAKQIPAVYHIKDAPYYREDNFCWGASAMMLMMHEGFTETEVQEFRTILKSGTGGPPDMFLGFSDFGVLSKVHIGYSKDYVKEYADFYEQQLLINPEEQATIFEDKNEALEKLKELISSDILVVIVGHHGNHYMVVTGYDENQVYISDPGFDNGAVYEELGQPGYEEKTNMPIDLFFSQWTISGFEGGGIGFPGDYGMVWFGKTVTLPKGEVICENFDNNQEECLLREECIWMPGENICEPIDEEEEFDDEDGRETEIPLSYHIENVPHYGEIEFCYGSSMMMLLGYYGFSEDEIQEYRTFVKSEGAGGPPDMFLGLENLDVMAEIKLGYSKVRVEEYSESYEELVDEPEKQIVLFDSQNAAFENLERLVSSDVPVIVLIHYGTHYVVVTGYDEDYIYTNDPGFDYSHTYKIDSDPELKQRRIVISDFFDEWNISAQEEGVGEAIGFPGDYGTIWFDIEIN